MSDITEKSPPEATESRKDAEIAIADSTRAALNSPRITTKGNPIVKSLDALTHSSTIANSAIPITAFADSTASAEKIDNPADKIDNSSKLSGKDIRIIATLLTSTLLIIMIFLIFWKRKLAKEKEKMDVLKKVYAKEIWRTNTVSTGSWQSLYSIESVPSVTPFRKETKSHRRLSHLTTSRNSTSTMLFPHSLPTMRFFDAVMNYLPKTQYEIATIAGDRIEVLEMKSAMVARVVNRRTLATGLIPVFVIGAEFVRD
jgi:hypothetical protein